MTRHSSVAVFIILFFIFLPITNSAQYIEQVEEISAGNFFGYGARQMGMGGAGIMAIDGTALFYNPANLARIPRIEFIFGISNQNYRDRSSVRPIRKIVDYGTAIAQVETLSPRFQGFLPVQTSEEDSKNNTRINSAIITVPYPTHRGSMVIGIGVARSVDFDKIFILNHIDTSELGDIIAAGSEFQSGGLYQWGAGIGIDLSPRIAFGGALYLYTGKHDYDWNYDLDSLNILSYTKEDLITDNYIGFNMKAALSVRLNQAVAIGMTAETPISFNVEEELNGYVLENGADSSYYDYIEYNVKKPFVFSGGISAQFNNAVLMADFDYTDWSQLEYGDNIDMEAYNDDIRLYYEDAVRFRFGGEYVIPKAGLSLRAGYFIDPLPIKSEFINNNRNGYSLGVGMLIDQVMTIDLAFVHASSGRNSDFIYSTEYDSSDNILSSHNLIIDEDISYNRLFLTTAYRF